MTWQYIFDINLPPAYSTVYENYDREINERPATRQNSAYMYAQEQISSTWTTKAAEKAEGRIFTLRNDDLYEGSIHNFSCHLITAVLSYDSGRIG